MRRFLYWRERMKLERAKKTYSRGYERGLEDGCKALAKHAELSRESVEICLMRMKTEGIAP